MDAILTAGILIFNISFAIFMFWFAKRELTKEAGSTIEKAKEEILPWIIEHGFPEFMGFLNSEQGQEFTNAFMDPIVSGLQKRIYGAIGGIASGEARGEKALLKAAGKDLVEGSHPLASTILDKLPSVKKLIMDNPALLALVPQIAKRYQGLLPNLTTPSNGNNPNQIRGL